MATPAQCPACGGPLRPWRRATASDPGLAGGDGYELARCQDCGTAVTLGAPEPEMAAALYEGGTYAATAGAADRLVEPLRRLAEADRMRSLGGLRSGARVLEIGAGDGRLVERMRARGLDARGIEPSASARAEAEERGIALDRELADAGASGEDAVVLWHVLEHLPDPVETLRWAREALAPGGRLVVATPNLDSLQARLGGDRWFHQDVPRHRTHFTAAGLAAMLRRCGFEAPRIRHLLVDQSPLGMWQTILNRVTSEPNVAFRLLKGEIEMRGVRAKLDAALTLLLCLPVALIAPVLELGAALARRGGSIVAIATVSQQRRAEPR